MNRNEESKSERKPMSLFLKFVLGTVLLLSLLFFAAQLMEYNRLRRATEEVKREIRWQEDAVEELRYLLQSPVDDQYIIRIARSELDLVFPDEDVFYHDYRP